MQKGELIAQGRTAEIFAWDDGHVLKLMREGWTKDFAEREHRIVKAIHDAGIPSPDVTGVIEMDGRFGVIYERVDGPTLLRAMLARPWSLWRSARLLAELHAKIHEVRLAWLPSLKEALAERIRRAPGVTDAQREAALQTLAASPDNDTLCHYDFHPDNVILSAHGPVVIDWESAKRGDPRADLARTSLLLRMGDPPPGASLRWLIQRLRKQFHTAYLRRYFELNPARRDQLEQWIMPSAIVRLDEAIPEEHTALMKMIGQPQQIQIRGDSRIEV
jgi:uncharacterized protein (TIGR02172 family)